MLVQRLGRLHSLIGHVSHRYFCDNIVSYRVISSCYIMSYLVFFFMISSCSRDADAILLTGVYVTTSYHTIFPFIMSYTISQYRIQRSLLTSWTGTSIILIISYHTKSHDIMSVCVKRAFILVVFSQKLCFFLSCFMLVF